MFEKRRLFSPASKYLSTDRIFWWIRIWSGALWKKDFGIQFKLTRRKKPSYVFFWLSSTSVTHHDHAVVSDVCPVGRYFYFRCLYSSQHGGLLLFAHMTNNADFFSMNSSKIEIFAPNNRRICTFLPRRPDPLMARQIVKKTPKVTNRLKLVSVRHVRKISDITGKLSSENF